VELEQRPMNDCGLSQAEIKTINLGKLFVKMITRRIRPLEVKLVVGYKRVVK
jgi:hypothetical protein